SLHLLLSSINNSSSSSAAGLWRISMLGGTPQKLADDAIGGVVSPDGAKLAFLRGQTQGNWTIWVAASDGRQPRPFLEIDDLEVSPGRPVPQSRYAESVVPRLAWSPNSLRLAYIHGVWATAPNPVENTNYAL